MRVARIRTFPELAQTLAQVVPEIVGSDRAAITALTDDGRAPLDAAGIRLVDRLAAVQASLDRVAEKGGSRATSGASAV